jgi:hypothetical protein
MVDHEGASMRRFVVSLGVVSILLGASASFAQIVTDSKVSGTLMSRTAIVPVGESGAVVLEVPEGGHFILTQACMSLTSLLLRVPFPSPILQWRLVGSELGLVPLSFGCTPFQPGVAFSAGERISCEVSSPTTVEMPCLVTGVLQREVPRKRHPRR